MNEQNFKALINNNVILQKHKDLLKRLSNNRIMCVGYRGEGDFYIMECFDEWFCYDLDKKECVELSELFREIAETLST